MEVFRALLHDADQGRAGGTSATGAHRAVRQRADGWAVGPLVLGDERLSGTDADVAVSVVASGGAGGVSALPRRASGLRLVGVETVLRDLDDLPGSATRAVAAATELTEALGRPEGLEVYVGLPQAPGLVEAVEVVEAAGLLGRLDLGAAGGEGRGPARAELLSVLVEADLAFKVTGAGTEPFGPYGLVAVLMAVEALVDGADPADAEELLARPDRDRSRVALARWDAAQQARVARRLRGVDCPDVAATLDTLTAAGLLDPDGVGTGVSGA